jgi:hypothetical protein
MASEQEAQAAQETPAEHPNGPRTFVTMIRDNAPTTAAVLQHLLRLETGRHPTLTDLRAALRLDLDISGWANAARAAWPPRGQIPDDDELGRVIDAAYGSMQSTRMVRVRIAESGPVATREHEPIRIREDEDLWLLAFASNETETGVEFSAEAHGDGIGGYVEPGRTGSGLLNAGRMHRGSYLLPLLVVAGGRTTTIDLPIECVPSGVLKVRLLDGATGEPIAARVYISDAVGEPAPGGAHQRCDRFDNAFFHAEGSFEARVSGRAQVTIVRGIEYMPYEAMIDVPPDGERALDVRLERWVDAKRDGWRSGDVHVHLHYGGELLLTPEDAALVQRAEDVHFMNMMVANQGTGWVHDEPYFEGKPNALSTPDYILRWGEEYRNNLYGHMCMYGIVELVPPIYSGFPLSEHAPDVPSNADAADHCHRVGGTLSYAHPMFDSIDLDRVFADEHVYSVEAKELPVDAALGKIDALDVMSYPGHELETSALWYRLLNCGIRLSATAGTDTFMNTVDQGAFSNPPAGDRVYALVDGDFTTESWCEAVREGRTFVTNGPMLSLEVNGATPGDEIAAHAGAAIGVVIEAGSYVPMERVELIVNGEVVATAMAEDDGQRALLAHEFTAQDTCWIAARAIGPEHRLALDTHVFAHTSPVYLRVDEQPQRDAASAAYFVEWIDRLTDLCARRAKYPDDASRERVAGLFREARAVYNGML